MNRLYRLQGPSLFLAFPCERNTIFSNDANICIQDCNSIAKSISTGFQRFHLKCSAFQIYYLVRETLEDEGGRRMKKENAKDRREEN